MRRLLMARHAPTMATRRSAFPADEPLDDRALRDAASLARALQPDAEVICSPAQRCRQTAAAAGLRASVDSRLAECDFGAWAGRSLEEIHAATPAAAERWMTDPDAAPHGGESLTAFARRVAEWLDGQRQQDGAALAITHGGVIKAALTHALSAPVRAFWRFEISPLSITELNGHDDGWTVSRVNCGADVERAA